MKLLDLTVLIIEFTIQLYSHLPPFEE